MSENRKGFQDLPGDENPQFLEDGMKIYSELRDKYPDESAEHLDNILNGLCAATVCMIKKNVHKDNYKYMLQLVYTILNKNLLEILYNLER